MSKLVVNPLRCVETTSGGGDDEIYMIVFRGSVSNPDVKVVGGADTAWGDMNTSKPNNLVKEDMVLDENYDAGNVYVVALLEQDWRRDILTDGVWGKVVEYWDNNWMKWSGTYGRETCALAALVSSGALSNDELLGMPQSVPQIYTTGGTGALLVFEGHGGKYRARFVKR